MGEEESEYRHPFRRDNSRLIHSASFRRLQGKTQLFPTYESDFFRNRLTHSLEVAQIAKGIAEYLNHKEPFFHGNNKIDLDLVETAALAHDLGHPPFGHNGEKALDDKMKDCGGFEGNAQTLRILAKLEKKVTLDGGRDSLKQNGDLRDNRCGLNFTYRTLASILKYDKRIPKKRDPGEEICKGYYYTEKDLVEKIKSNVLRDKDTQNFKSLECQIMDIADDIAYCTYDLEDALKAEFLSPLKILNSSDLVLEKVAAKVRKHCNISDFTEIDVIRSLKNIFSKFISKSIEKVKTASSTAKRHRDDDIILLTSLFLFELSEKISCDGYHRTGHTSEMVHSFTAVPLIF